MTQLTLPSPHQASLRRVPTQERAVARRAKIIAGAEALLRSEGHDGFSIRKVAAVSGVGIGTIYDYFPAREDLLHILIEAHLERRFQIFDAVWASTPLKQGIEAFIPTYVERLLKEGFWSAYDGELRQAAAADEALGRVFDWYESEIVRRYAQGMVTAGSTWPLDELITVARFNTIISQQLERAELRAAGALGIDLVANALIANLKLVLQPKSAGQGSVTTHRIEEH